jgi:Family of unknown function (DUF5681)
MSANRLDSHRDRAGRFRPGAPSPNPKGRPKKARGVDAAMLGALAEKVTVNEQGRRKRKSKLDITAAQIANKGAGGDLRAAKMALDQVRMAEERADADAVRVPVMTQSDHEIAGRVIARLTRILSEGGAGDPSQS